MKNKSCYSFLIAGIMAFSVMLPLSSAYADRLSDQTRSEVKELRSVLKKVKRLVSRASARKTLAALSTSGLTDTDGDGLPDLFELALGSSSCDSDSDDDGISDDDESESGSKPDDSSSGEIEVKGTISAITDTTVTIGGNTFVATEDTSYLEGATSLASFKVGDFVEAKGKLQSGVLNLVKIKIED